MPTWRGGDSEGRPPPSAPRPPPSAWKGMGAPCLCRTIHPLHTTTSTSTTTATVAVHPCHQPLAPRHLLLLLVLLIVCTLAGVPVSAFSLQGSSHCQIDQCFEQFNSAKDTLHLSAGAGAQVPPMGGGGRGGGLGVAGGGGGGVGEGEEEGEEGEGLQRESMCVALRTYWSCIQNSSRGCQGDIRYYSVRNGVKQQMQHLNCSVHGRTVDPSRGPPPPRVVPPQCRYQGGQGQAHCGLFGDPHLRTFDQRFETCRVKGAWPLVNNQYLTVQVTNHPVLGAAGDATATSKLTVIVKSRPECGWDQYHTYQAQTDELPGAFEDGHTHYGHYRSVRLEEVSPNRHVEIVLDHIATRLIVRQIGRYFTFAIHMPRDLAHEGSTSPEPELCSKGCPPSELIDYRRYLAHKKEQATRLQQQRQQGSSSSSGQVTVTRQEAEVTCRGAGLVDFYFDSCVFDLLATGDSNFTVAALSALQDVVRLDPSMARVANRTSLSVYDDLFGGSPPSCCLMLRGWGCWVSWVLSLLWVCCLTGRLPCR
ncbi:repulsive guidance molecule A-like isoform X2 [Babylonia areolata]|uniref:repulsive guidance molecule A-like isoform X2 n=1 Tax=Babylonia areolata TaxID=304850 RepID=UPI003FD25A47